jgi:hypothetical protein
MAPAHRETLMKTDLGPAPFVATSPSASSQDPSAQPGPSGSAGAIATGSLPLARRTSSPPPSSAQAKRLATLQAEMQNAINQMTVAPNMLALPTVEAFLTAPLPPPPPPLPITLASNNPLHVTELREMITGSFSVADVWALSQVDRTLRHQMTPERTRIARVNTAIRRAIGGVLTANSATTCEDLHHATTLQGLQGLGPALRQLGQALGLPADAHALAVLTELVKHLPVLPHARHPAHDVQLQTIYFLRAVLPRVQIVGEMPAMNRLAEATLEALPRVWPGRHFKPGEHGAKAFAAVALPFADAGDATCGAAFLVGLPLAAVAGAAAAAGSMVFKKGTTTNRLLNLFRQISHRMPLQGFDTALVLRVVDTLEAHPGGRGKHLTWLRGSLDLHANIIQMAGVQARLQAAGW